MTVSLRIFRPEDAQLIARWASAVDLGGYVSRSRPRDPLATCHDPQSGLFWFVIVHSGADVGTVWLEPGERSGESVLGIFLCHPSLCSRGLGSQTIRLAVEECRAERPEHVITLRVRQSNARAIACYRKVGFVVTSSGTKVLPSGEQLPCYHMRLPSRAVQERGAALRGRRPDRRSGNGG